MELFTSYPPAGIETVLENGSALTMKPGQVIETDLVAVADEGKSVRRIRRDGSVEM